MPQGELVSITVAREPKPRQSVDEAAREADPALYEALYHEGLMSSPGVPPAAAIANGCRPSTDWRPPCGMRGITLSTI